MSDEMGEESLHHKSERRAMQVITDAVFGLSLGLGAFSLTEFEISTVQDVFFAIGFFAVTYFLVSLFWIWVRRFFEDLPIYGEGMTGALWVLCFFVAIMPFIMRLFVSGMFGGPEEVVFLAQTMLYPLDMAAISIVVGSMHVLFLKQARTRTPWEDYKHIASDSVTAFVLGFGFFLMALLPTDMTLTQLVPIGLPATIGDIPAKFGIWLIVAIIGTIAYVAVEIVLRRMQT